MEAIIDKITQYCVDRQIITPEQQPWLKYNLFRRVSSAIGIALICVLGAFLAGWQATAGFLVGFLSFRPWINGYHASTWVRCLISSVIIEVIFLAGVLRLVGNISALIITAVCFAVMLLAAPYDHPNMHYSKEELLALKRRIRILSAVWTVVTAALYYFRLYTLVRGLATGFAMATFLLLAAYFHDWRTKHANH